MPIIILTKDEEKNEEDALASDANGCAEVITEGDGTLIPATSEAFAAALKRAMGLRLAGEAISGSARPPERQKQLKKLVGMCTGGACQHG